MSRTRVRVSNRISKPFPNDSSVTSNFGENKQRSGVILVRAVPLAPVSDKAETFFHPRLTITMQSLYLRFRVPPSGHDWDVAEA